MMVAVHDSLQYLFDGGRWGNDNQFVVEQGLLQLKHHTAMKILPQFPHQCNQNCEFGATNNAQHVCFGGEPKNFEYDKSKHR
jgi:hypothetical protein